MVNSFLNRFLEQ